MPQITTPMGKNPTNATRTLVRAPTVLAVLVLALGACANLPRQESTGFTRFVPAPPALVAWVAATLAVQQWPGADPVPVTGSVPVAGPDAGDTDGGFRVEVGLAPGRAVFACNGRLARPRHVGTSTGTARLATPTFTPSPIATRAQGSAGSFHCTIKPAAAGTELWVRFTGPAAEAGIVRRLMQACDTWDVAPQIEAALAAGEWAHAAALCNQTFELDRRLDRGGLGELAAPLWCALATARRELGALPEARAALNSACDAAPHESYYDVVLGQLNERLARFAGSASGLDAIADGASDARARLAARARRAERDRSGESQPSLSTIASQAARFLDSGDIASADAWANRLRAQNPALRGMPAAQRARALGHRRESFVHTLESLVRTGFDAEALELLVEDAIACDDPTAGLHALSRHWRAIGATQPERGERLARRLMAALGPVAAARIAVSENCGALALLAETGDNSHTTRAEVAAVRRVDLMRRQLDIESVGAALAAPPR